MQELALIVGMLLAVYGLIELVERLSTRLLFPGERVLCSVVPLLGEGEDVEYRIRQAFAWYRLSPGKGAEPVFLDCGLTERGRALAEAVGSRLGVSVYRQEDWCEMLSGGLQEQEIVVQ